MAEDELASRVAHILRPSVSIYPEQTRTWVETLMKSAVRNEEERSNQGEVVGVKSHPFDMSSAIEFVRVNAHHAAAIAAKKNSTTGLGFLTEGDKKIRLNQKRAKIGLPPVDISDEELMQTQSKVASVLDPLCEISMQDLMDQVGEDLAHTHNAYIEVVRRKGDGITSIPTGLHRIPAKDVRVYVENIQHDFHFEVDSTGVLSGTRRLAAFGDKAKFMQRMKNTSLPNISPVDEAENISEVIHLRYPSAISRWYGVPTWLSAVAAIELVRAMHQHEFDFYNNRGVPEFLLFLLGKRLGDKDWAAVSALIQSNIGLGNTHKTGALNFPEGIAVQVEKLALEGKSDGRFSEMSNALALDIVTGHRIPPLLAGIQIPGKLGATNELPNALMSYQILVVAPDQSTIRATFGATLGNSLVNGGLGLTFEDFDFKTILDIMDLGNMDTVARMRQTVPEAQEEGRDLDEGLVKAIRGNDPAGVVAAVMAGAIHRIRG